MLLLVLILVLVAFGLLVVALLTGNVLCAWLSVAVSVAAAVVLVVDWLQRRSALKAGATAAAAPASPSAETILLGEPDPVTEVLPVVHPLSDHSLSDPAGANATGEESRFDRPLDGQQTIIMPAVQPSGSTARPSGAEGSTTSSGGSSSPSVTKPREPAPADASRSTTDSRDGDPEATVSVNIRKGADGRTAGAPVGGASGDGAQAADGARAGTSDSGSETAAAASSGTERSGSDAEWPAGTAAAGGAAAVAATSAMPPARQATGAATGAQAGPAGALPTRSREGAVDGLGHERPGADGPTSGASGASVPRADVSDDQAAAPTVTTMRGVERPDSRAAGIGASDGRKQADSASDETATPDSVADSESTIVTSSAVAATTTPGPADRAPADSTAADSTAADSTAAADKRAAVDPAAVGPVAVNPVAVNPVAVNPDAVNPDAVNPAAVDKQAADSAVGRGALGDEATRSTFGGPISSGHELFDPVNRSTAASDPPPSSGGVEETAVMSSAAGTRQVDESDPPEEPFDPDVARIVARMDDEVFVIDEQPRYHVASCRAVATQATIPLAAREAIELGFTPCGWCTPDAVLGERGRASARP